MKKNLLPGMMAALAFAACTNEEIVSQQTVAVPEADLSQRPVVGMVDLYFGSQTRMAQGVEGFNDLDWTDGDKIGARIIDELGGVDCGYHASTKYLASDYAWSNYRYDYSAADEMWTSDALMVEGNYMFYAPYDETALYRTALKMEFPTLQTVNGLQAVELSEDVKENAAIEANTSAVANFFANKEGQTVVVGHTFVSAEDGGTSVSPEMIHLYAYPVITIVNDYTVPDTIFDAEGEVEDIEQVGAPITIDEITISSRNIHKYYTANHSNLIEALKHAKAKVDNPEDAENPLCGGHSAGVLVGNRKTVAFMRNARTSLIATAQDVDSLDGKVVVALDEPVVIPAGQAVKLNVVLPAETYDDADLLVNVRVLVTENGKVKQMKFSEKAFVGDGELADDLTYAIMKRLPVEEYNFPANNADPYAKASASTLATFHLDGELVDYTEPDKEPVNHKGIKDNDGFYAWLASVTDNSTPKVEGEEFQLAADHKVVFNAELVARVNEYLNDARATVVFTSRLDVEGPVTIDGDKFVGFDSLVVTKGAVTLDGVKAEALVVKAGATANIIGATTISKISEVQGNVELNGATLGAADKTITFKGTAKLTNVTINGDVIFEESVEFVSTKISGKATFKKGGIVYSGATANSAAIIGGTVTLEGSLGDIEVYNGATLNLNVEDYAGKITLGKDVTPDNGKDDPTVGNLVVSKNQKALNVVSVNSVITNNAEVKFTATEFSWAGTLTNNGTIKSDIEVIANSKYVHNADAKVDATLFNKADGTVENNGKLALTNNGLVVVGDGGFTKTDVVDGIGRINNTALGYVTGTLTTQTIFVKTGAFSNDAAWKDMEIDNSKVNTLYIDGKWTVTEDVTAGKFNYEFVSDGSLALGAAAVDFNAATSVKILSNQTWTGLDADVSEVENATITLGSYKSNNVDVCYTLTTTDINMGDAYANAVNSALNAGGTVTLTQDLTLSSVLKVSDAKNAVLNLNGFDITAAVNTDGENSTSYALHVTNGKLTINGSENSKVSTGDAYYSIPVWAGTDAEVIINGGEYENAGDGCELIYATGNGKITINSGKFIATAKKGAEPGTANLHTALNLYNNGADGCDIVVNGGEFINFNPANNYSENPQKNFCAAGTTLSAVGTKDGKPYTFADPYADAYDARIKDTYGIVTYTVSK